MILSIDSNDANSAPLHKKTISSLSGAVESMMKKLEDVGVLVARILMPILFITCLLYTSPSPRDLSTSRMPSSA